MQYLIFKNNFKNTLRTFSGCFCRKHPMYKDKISLNPQNTCSFKWVFTVFSETKVTMTISYQYHNFYFFVYVFFTKDLQLFLQILVRVEQRVQTQLAVTTRVRIMTDKLQCPAVFNCGLCRTLVNTE